MKNPKTILLAGALFAAITGLNPAHAATLALEQLSCDSSNDHFGEDEPYLLTAFVRSYAPAPWDSGAWRLPGSNQYWNLNCGGGSAINRIPILTEFPPAGGHLLVALNVVESDDDPAARVALVNQEMVTVLKMVMGSQPLDPMRPYLDQVDRQLLAKLTRTTLSHLDDDDWIGTMYVEVWTDGFGRPQFSWAPGPETDTLQPASRLPYFDLHGSGSRYRALLTLFP